MEIFRAIDPVIAVAFAMLALVVWASAVVWTLADIRSRSRDRMVQMLMVLLVCLGNLVGLLAYLLLRPRETLIQAYERSLLGLIDSSE